ncbi:hypothetical protein FDE76_15075 [Clostridium botulinum]|uniref:Membrane protein n=2 Tax=Clostridium botulinum TaxID=1491 RepID=B2TS92_CLOBB|nr:hypothetical protein [Clostridium botulinum]ACD14167.1 putative membrane protein [Clostridium botulinum B str. Eklund 17B (NRP)]AIW54491.1 putative N-terminal transmembrane protein with C-terminal repeat [Clostridium botulinum]AIW54545.1 putative N-terminal transmembrane protein with C-terminal repeat [Clostridium botulinum]MBY6977819.1 hypothetical protein [Clostridium botulinum]MBY7002360.1 hypothetical protein [Clostridium botulinum]
MNGLLLSIEGTARLLHDNNITQIADVISIGFRWIGWRIIEFLSRIINTLEASATKLCTLNGFFNSTEVNTLINRYKPLVWMILGISIAIIGMKIIFNRVKNRGDLAPNLMFSVCVLILLPVMMLKIDTMSTLAIQDLNSYNISSANTIVKNNLHDIYYLDSVNYNLTGNKNNISANDILSIDINEKLDTDNISISHRKIFKNKIIKDSNGSSVMTKLKQGWFLYEQFYRYNLDFVVTLISLGAIGITLICISLKSVRLIFEIAVNKFLATLFAFADIESGKKLKAILKHIGSMFAVLVTMSVMLKFYVLFNSYLSRIESTNPFDDFTKVIVILGVSVAVIDGPNIIEQVFGIDAGLKSGLGVMVGGYGAARVVGGIGKGIAGEFKRMLSNPAEKLKNKVKSGISEKFAGNKDKSGAGNNNLANEMKSNNDKSSNKDKNLPTLQEQMNNKKNNNNEEKGSMKDLNDRNKPIDKAINNISNKDIDKPINDAIKNLNNKDNGKPIGEAMNNLNSKDNGKPMAEAMNNVNSKDNGKPIGEAMNNVNGKDNGKPIGEAMNNVNSKDNGKPISEAMNNVNSKGNGKPMAEAMNNVNSKDNVRPMVGAMNNVNNKDNGKPMAESMNNVNNKDNGNLINESTKKLENNKENTKSMNESMKKLENNKEKNNLINESINVSGSSKNSQVINSKKNESRMNQSVKNKNSAIANEFKENGGKK